MKIDIARLQEKYFIKHGVEISKKKIALSVYHKSKASEAYKQEKFSKLCAGKLEIKLWEAIAICKALEIDLNSLVINYLNPEKNEGKNKKLLLKKARG